MKSKKFFKWLLAAVMVGLMVTAVAGCEPEEEVEPEEPEAEPTPGVVEFATDHEFMVREDGLPALEEAYDFEFDEVHDMAIGLTHEALRDGDVCAAMGFATDGKIEALDLVNLEDDQKFFPVYNPSPVVREEVLEEYPEIEELLGEIAPMLDTDTMINLNFLVDIEGYEPDEVAEEWLMEEGLISEDPEEPAEGDPVVVGSKEFSEQQTLSQIALMVLEHAGIPVEDSTNLGGTEVNRTALEEGDIDMYWEYTGTAWLTFFEEEEVITDSEEVYQLVKERDAEEGLIWLDYAPFDNTYTIMMRSEHAEELGIETISQLAEWVKQVQAGEEAVDEEEVEEEEEEEEVEEEHEEEEMEENDEG